MTKTILQTTNFQSPSKRLGPSIHIWHQYCSDDMVCTTRQEMSYIYVVKMICAIFNLTKMKPREDRDPGERNLGFHSNPPLWKAGNVISIFAALSSVPSLTVHEIIWELWENASAHAQNPEILTSWVQCEAQGLDVFCFWILCILFWGTARLKNHKHWH